jgi:hypothetical protein
VEDKNSELYFCCVYFPATNCLCIWVHVVCIFRQRIVCVSEWTVSVFSGNELPIYLSAQCLYFPATNCLYIWVHGVCIFRQRIVSVSECTVSVFSGNELSVYLSARCLYFPATNCQYIWVHSVYFPATNCLCIWVHSVYFPATNCLCIWVHGVCTFRLMKVVGPSSDVSATRVKVHKSDGYLEDRAVLKVFASIGSLLRTSHDAVLRKDTRTGNEYSKYHWHDQRKILNVFFEKRWRWFVYLLRRLDDVLQARA